VKKTDLFLMKATPNLTNLVPRYNVFRNLQVLVG